MLNKKKFLKLISLLSILILLDGCVKNSRYCPGTKGEIEDTEENFKPYEKILLEREQAKKTGKNVKQALKDLEKKDKKVSKALKNTELDFKVENKTGKTIYATCFSYINKQAGLRWRWDKSEIYKLKPNDITIIDIDTIIDRQNRDHIYGYLAVFNTLEEAENSTYELLEDKDKIDLDLLVNLKNKKVTIEEEKYGFTGKEENKILSYDFRTDRKIETDTEELDILVENRTGSPLYITCFVYQIKKDMPTWRYDKTPVIKILPDGTGTINVDTQSNIAYDKVYVRGYLAVFKNKKDAEESTFELLEPGNKKYLGRLVSLLDKKIILNVEKYGISGTFIDYTVQPTAKINFEKKFKNL